MVMIQGLFSVDEVAAMINNGDSLLLAGDATLLKSLPKGKWIAGVTGRFIENGKDIVTTREKIFVHNMTGIAADVKFEIYDASNIKNIYDDAFDHGFSVLIMPLDSEVANEYAINCINYSNFACRAVCGWYSISQYFEKYEGNDVSLVFSGESGLSYVNAGVVMHIALPPEKYAEIHTFSPFVPESDDVLVFEETGRQVEYVLVNGVRQSFRQYLIDQKFERSLEACNGVLSGDYAGIIINTGVFPESEYDQEKYVSLAGVALKDIQYRIAKLDSDNSYITTKKFDGEIVFSFSCITNCMHQDIFLKYLAHTNGPFVYGEIAYFYLNYSTVYVTVGNS